MAVTTPLISAEMATVATESQGVTLMAARGTTTGLKLVFGESSGTHAHKDSTVGLSCLFLLLVAFYPTLMGDVTTGSAATVVAIFSILADYVYVEQPSAVWHDLDRLTAVGFTTWVTVRAASVSGWAPALLWTILSGGMPFAFSRASASKEQWRFRHSLFHLMCAVALFGSLHNVYQQQ